MIPRTLVPVNVRPVTPDEAKKPGHRTDHLHGRPHRRPVGLFRRAAARRQDQHSRASSARTFWSTARSSRAAWPSSRFERFSRPLRNTTRAILDSRIVVPAYVEPADSRRAARNSSTPPELTAELREVIEPDIFITGDANLLIEPEERRDAKWDLVTRVLSVLVHIGLIIFLIFTPKIFPAHVPTQEEIELAQTAELISICRRTLPNRRAAGSQAAHHAQDIEPSALRPWMEQPRRCLRRPSTPQRAPSDLPEAPTPRVPVNPQPAPTQPTAARAFAPRADPALAPQHPNHLNLELAAIISRQSDSGSDSGCHSATRARPRTAIYIRRPSRGRGRRAGHGPGHQILSDTQGVDFSSYIQRLLATLKRNWEAVMPESARMGDKGMVYTTFQSIPTAAFPRPIRRWKKRPEKSRSITPRCPPFTRRIRSSRCLRNSTGRT